MTKPLWINAGAGEVLGTAVIAEAADEFTLDEHGLDDGDRVTFAALGGGAVGVLAEAGVYFVRDATVDTFRVATFQGGPPVTFAADGAADVFPFQPAYTARELRRGLSGLLTRGAERFAGRAGVHPADDPVVEVSGSTWTVRAHSAVVHPGHTTHAGAYMVAVEQEAGGLDPADGALHRVDALDLLVEDDHEDESGQRRGRIVYVTGDPAADPEAPPVTAGALRLTPGGILVPAGGSPAPSLRDPGPPYTVAAGGVLPVRDAAELPSSGLYDGLAVWRRDLRELLVRDGGLWLPPARGWQHIDAGEVDDAPSFVIDLTRGGAYPAGTFTMIRLHLKGRTTSLVNVTVRMNNDGTSDLHQSSFITWDTSESSPVVPDETDSGLLGSTGRLGRWSTSLRMNTIEATFHDTGVESRCSYRAESFRQPTNAGNFAQHMRAWGSLQENRLLSSLGIRTAGLAADFNGLTWHVEGYRA